jgi:glucan 1,3-beta-glucosidase
VLYDYQFANAKNTWMGAIQHETAYYQGNPPAPVPFTPQASWNDPDFSDCKKDNCPRTWGVRFLNSSNIYNYGGGHYMFFRNWDSPSCLDAAKGLVTCQERIIDFRNATDIWLWGLSTVGVENMISWEGVDLVPQAVNRAGFTQTILLFEMTGKQ